MTSPCLNCLHREVGCHINCEQYKKFKALSSIDKLRRNRDMARHSTNKPTSFKLERMLWNRWYRGKFNKNGGI